MDLATDLFALCWEHRRNPLIPMGGFAMACLGVGLAVNNVPWVTPWFKPVPFVGFSLLALLFVVLLFYYILKALITFTKRLFTKVSAHSSTHSD
jgi:tellurite resistance protein TehA-like permease